MTLAHEVTNSERSIPSRVAASLRQRLGAQRMDLWFGAEPKWSLSAKNEIEVQVSSQFMADCIGKMFRDDMAQAIQEAAGSNFGYRVTVATDSPAEGSSPEDSKSHAPRRDISGRDSSGRNTSGRDSSAGEVSDRSVQNGVELEPPAVRAPSLPSSPSIVPISRSVPSATPRSVASQRASAATQEEAKSAVDRLAEIRRENERRWNDFLQGDHNRLAYTAATMVLEKPGQITPLFLHGPHGCGKTHLAVGLAHKLRSTYKMRRVLVLTGEQFTIEYTDSARGGGFANFRRKYRDVDVLVLDDMQFCMGKAGTLAELRNTIDMLLRDRRQVILVADRSLNELNGLTSDLHARLAGGMTCGIEPLDVETRVRLLQVLCEQQRVQIPPSTVRELAAQAAGDGRVLQGLAHRLVAQQRMLGGELTHEQAIRCTLDLVRASQPVVRMNDIERVVCETFGLDEKALRGKTKCQTVSQPRMLAMFLSRKYTRSALSEIGEYFGKRQHSTVISAQRKVETWLDEDELLQCGRGKLTVKEILKNLESTLRVG